MKLAAMQSQEDEKMQIVTMTITRRGRAVRLTSTC